VLKEEETLVDFTSGTSLFVMVIAGAVVLETCDISTQKSRNWVLLPLKMSCVASQVRPSSSCWRSRLRLTLSPSPVLVTNDAHFSSGLTR